MFAARAHKFRGWTMNCKAETKAKTVEMTKTQERNENKSGTLRVRLELTRDFRLTGFPGPRPTTRLPQPNRHMIYVSHPY